MPSAYPNHRPPPLDIRCPPRNPWTSRNFLRVLQDHTAGDPMRQDVKWTDLTQGQIADRLAEAGTAVSTTVVKQLLRRHRYVKRKARRPKAMGQHRHRNQQFET